MKAFIEDKLIKISDVSYKPSNCYPSRDLQIENIDCQILGLSSPVIRTNEGEILYFDFSERKIEELTLFSERNNIPTVWYYDVWSDLLEPFLDAEFSAKEQDRTMERLIAVGLQNAEILSIRTELEEMMLDYNIKSGMWDWVNLNMTDLFDACTGRINSIRMSDEYFGEFYWKAMKIQDRGRNRRMDNAGNPA